MKNTRRHRTVPCLTDAEGNVTRYTYTTTGDLACEFVDADNDGVLDTGESYVSYTYDTLGRATGIDANGMAYSLTYNEAGLPYQIKVGTTAIATYTYTGDYTKRASVTYANGLTESYIYDILGNVKEYRRNSTSVCTYDYDGNGNLIRKNDVGSGKITEYLYNALGEQLASRIIDSSNELLIYSDERTDAVNDDITYTDTKYVLNGVEITYTTQYDSSDDTSKYILPTTAEISSEQDIFGRLSSRYIKGSNDNDILTYTYSYEGRTDNNVDYTSNAVSSVTLSSGISYSYTYDDNGNITGVTTAADPYSDAGDYVSYSTGPLLTTYEYDDLGELVRENNPIADKTWTYSYDGNGNILSKSEYAYTTGTLPSTPQSTISYTYGNSTWVDQLTNYDSQTITYDAQGNPLNWKNGETLTWSGRRLESWDDGQHTYTFTYDENGNRTRTAVGTSVNEYIYDDDGKIIQNGTITYYYDEDGCPVALKNGNYLFYYQFNEQGDVTGLIDINGNLVLINEYDAWGNDIGGEYTASRARAAWKKNIYRYRGKYGYVYDKDLDLYYLKTRFYDPEVGRFLNEDDPDYLCVSGTTLGGNLYAYCENDGVNATDEEGNSYNLYRFNCYAYAFGIYDRWLIIGKGLSSKYDMFGKERFGYSLPYFYSVNDLKNWVKRDFGKNVRVISGKFSDLKKGEYMIAARISLCYEYRRLFGIIIPSLHTLDFHFWKQSPYTRKWYNKHGSGKIELLGCVDPNYSYSAGWSNGYYNSMTVFFAYKKDFMP